MNRLFRRIRRRVARKGHSPSPRLSARRSGKPHGELALEPLENRVLLTTLTLPAGQTGELRFVYADPQDNSPGSDVSQLNELRIGTLSGEAPTQDIAVELLNYAGENVPGDVYVPGAPSQSVFGGPGGIAIIDEVGNTGVSMSALATDPAGITYGIDNGGNLVRIDTMNANATVIGAVEDTNAVGAANGLVQYTSFEAAAFDPNILGFFYAVVTGPTRFDANGNAIAEGQVLISVDVATGEADPIGRDRLGVPQYNLSQLGNQVFGTEITTIAYSQEGNDNANNVGQSPVFIGYDGGDLDQYVRISVGPGLLAGVDVGMGTIVAAATADQIVEGLMYGEDKGGGTWLFALDGTANQLATVNLTTGELTPVIAYPEGVTLAGMSYDSLNSVGYATDPSTGDLYRINTTSLIVGDNGELVVEGGLADIYTIYVASSTPDVFITVTPYDPESVEVYTPTAGSGSYLFSYDGTDYETPGEAGGAMIGTYPLPRENDVVWTPTTYHNANEVAANLGQVGVWPGGDLRPGIIVAPDAQGQPQDIGKIQVGGGVFGDVNVSGSIGTFYAGYLGTNRFITGGDCQQILVHTEAGGRTFADGAWWPVDEAIMEIGGEMNGYYSQGDWGMPVRVMGRTDAPEFPGMLNPYTSLYVRSYREIERKEGLPQTVPSFPSGSLDVSGGHIMTNDSLLDAEMIGTIDGKISVIGETEGPASDPEDYYSFGVMAGQTITITLYDTGFAWDFTTGNVSEPDGQVVINGNLSLIDPNGVVVGRNGEINVENRVPLPLVYTAEEAGIYTVMIGYLNPSYRLEVEGVNETTLGGGAIITDMRSDPLWFSGNAGDGIVVARGNMGALRVNGVLRSGWIEINEGGVAGIYAGVGGAVPVGFNWEKDTVGAIWPPSPRIRTAGDVGHIYSPVDSVVHIMAGGDLQSVEMGASFTGEIVARDNIGDISITGDYGSGMVDDAGVIWGWSDQYNSYGFTGPCGIFANSDGEGAPGIIDRIYVGGNFGLSYSFPFEIPVATGGRGGNVRYVDIGGEIFIISGGWIDLSGYGTLEFNPGQTVTLTDDSGSLVTVTPGYTGSDQTDEFGQPIATEDGGTLTIQMLPVRDIVFDNWTAPVGDWDETVLGYAIAQIDSTDSVTISATGGAAELGVINVIGNVAHSVVFTGGNNVSVLQLNAGTGITSIVNNTRGDMVAINIGETTVNTPVTPDEGDGDGDGDTGGTGTGGTGTGTDGTGTGTDGATDDTPIEFELISVLGHIGYTPSTTGQIVETVILVPAAEPADPNLDPVGNQRSGLVSNQGIQRIVVAGSLGDTNVTGDVNRILVNSDGSNVPNQFDGIAGAVLINGTLEYIDLGDGIAHPGRGDYALSGLFATGTLQTVAITGFGHDINGPIIATEGIDLVRVSNGARIVGYNAYETGRNDRVRGAYEMGVSIGVSVDLDNYIFPDTVQSGSIGTIEVVGADSELRGANIMALNVDNILVHGGAEGMFYSKVNLSLGSQADFGILSNLSVGGAGIHDCIIIAGREVTTVTVQPGGTIEHSEIRSNLNIGKVTADSFNAVDITAFNKVNSVSARQGIFDLIIEAGALGSLTATNDILGSALFIAGPVDRVQTGGDLISTIEVTGPFGDLKNVQVGGDIGTTTGGEIIVDGKIGNIRAGGDILAGFLLNWDPSPVSPQNPQGPHKKYDRNDTVLQMISAGGSINGIGDIGGNVGMVMCGGSFGTFGDELRIHGDAPMLMIGRQPGQSNLESGLTVDGTLGTVFVFGSVNGQINVADDFRTLLMLGTPTDRADLNASIGVGNTFGVHIIIQGDVAATDVTTGAPLQIVAQRGPTSIIIGSDMDQHSFSEFGESVDINGTLSGSYVSASDVNRLSFGGDVAPGAVIFIDGDLDELVVGGNIEGLVHVTGNIGRIVADNVTDTATITAGGDIRFVNIDGTVSNTHILAGFDPGVVSTALQIHDDLAADGVLDAAVQLTVDGTAVDPNEAASSGSITTVDIGTLNNSVVAAGVSPGVNTIFGDTDGSDSPGAGNSTIGNVTIGATVGDGLGTPFGVFSDSRLGFLRVGGVFYTATPISQPNGFRAWTVAAANPGSIGGFTFQAGLPFRATVGGTQVMLLMVGPGTGEVLLGPDQIDTIQLLDTNSSTMLLVLGIGGPADVGHLFTGDDDSLGIVMINGRIANATNDATFAVDGDVRMLRLSGIGAGANMQIDGAVATADLGLIEGLTGLATTIDIADRLGQFTTTGIGVDAAVTAASINQAQVRGELAGSLNTDLGDLVRANVQGVLSGVISSAADIQSVRVSQAVTGAVRAAQDLGSLNAPSMDTGVVAAGRDLREVRITGNVAYSTIASGLDVGANGDPFSGADVSSNRGDLDRVWIGGDLIQSNVVAGLAPGADNLFGTADDIIEGSLASQVDAPQIIDIRFPDDYTIEVEFRDVPMGAGSNIGDVTIVGRVFGSNDPVDHFAIAASGEIGRITAHQSAFAGIEGLAVSNLESKGILASTITAAGIDSEADALAAAFRVRTDGLDHIFGTADDVYVFGDGNPLTDPSVYVTFDQATNTAAFHNTDGFTATSNGTNYFQILIDAAIVTNVQGINLDGETTSLQFPTGNGIPGGDFEYYFAVEDLGDSSVTAFTPFGDQLTPANIWWNIESRLGDNLNFVAEETVLDEDYIRLNGLEQGQVLNLQLGDGFEYNYGSGWWYNEETRFEVSLLRVSDDLQRSRTVRVYDADGRDDLDPQRAVVAPNLDQIAYDGTFYVGYDSQGRTFYRFDPETNYTTLLLDNDLDELNTLVSNEGTIAEIQGLTGHSSDSFWTVAEFVQPGGASSEKLIRIDRLTDDVNSADPWRRAAITVAPNAVGYDNIVGLAELNGNLYGVDQVAGVLVSIDTTTGVGTEIGSLGNSDLVITGLAAAADGTGLVGLHDQPADTYTNLLVDALYTIDTTTGAATLLRKLNTNGNDRELSGLAADREGAFVAGAPLRGQPVNDTFDITFGDLGTLEHVFGAELTDFRNGNTVDSAASRVMVNSGQQQFLNSGFYWAFDVAYAQPAGLDTLTVTLSDIEWINDTDNTVLTSVVTDDPDNVNVAFGANTIQLTINAVNGDGDVRVYFAGTAELTVLPAPSADTFELIGSGARDDLAPRRDMVLPCLSELAVARDALRSEFSIDLTPQLDADLSAVLTPQQMNDLRLGLTSDLNDDIILALTINGDPDLMEAYIEAVTVDTYETLAYDADQAIFAAMDAQTYSLLPIMITDPLNPNNEIPLTTTLLSTLYQNSYNPDITINSVRAFEFGRDDMLWCVANVTDAATGVTRESLLGVEDITDPIVGMHLATYNLEVVHPTAGVVVFNVTDLAYGLSGEEGFASELLYGIDSETGSLIRVDQRRQIRISGEQMIANTQFGTTTVISGQLGNLGPDPVTLTGLDFGPDGILYTVDDSRDLLLKVNTNPTRPVDESRLQLVDYLPTGDYGALTFDADTPAQSGDITNVAILGRCVTGSPLDVDPNTVGDQGDVFQVTVNNTTTANHTFGGAATPVGGLTIDSSANTTAQMAAEGGYFFIDVTYPLNQGDIRLDLTDIDWPSGSSGEVNSVVLDDFLHAQTATFNTDSISILINSDTGAGAVRIYFAAAADMVQPSVTPTDHATTVSWNAGTLTTDAAESIDIPEDGDYIMLVSLYDFGGADPVTYDLDIMLFDDGNSDFGVATTASGILYDQVVPNNAAVDISLGSPDIDPDPTNPASYINHPYYPIAVQGGLVPGQASAITIDADLGVAGDFDVYSFQLAEGQFVTVDLEADTLFGRDGNWASVGVYNGDLELLATINDDTEDTMPAAVQADPYYSVQAVFEMPDHPGVVIDPSANGLGIYYVVVTGASSRDNDVMPYQLNVTTTDPQAIATPESQLVYLAFDGAEAQYLVSEYGGMGGTADVTNRPVFDADAYDLDNMRTALIAEIADRVEQIFRDAGLTNREIEFTTTKPPLGRTYSTVIFGGVLPDFGLFGIAEQLDRHNAVRDDMAVVLTDEIARFYMGGLSGQLSDDATVRFDEAATLLANVGAHELGHILGLEHAEEINTPEPNNLMGYNDFQEPQELEERNDPNGSPFFYWQRGFTNEVDMLLRNIGDGTAMGA